MIKIKINFSFSFSLGQPVNCRRHPLGCVTQSRVVEMDILVGGGRASMSEQSSGAVEGIDLNDEALTYT